MNQLPWFSTKGQIIQTLCAAFAALVLAYNQWPTIRESRYSAPGVLATFAVVGIALVSALTLRRTSISQGPTQVLWLLTAAAAGAAAWAHFVDVGAANLKIVGYGAAPVEAGKKVVMTIGVISAEPVKVIGTYTVRYVDRIPDSLYQRKGLESGIWQDFISNNPGPPVPISVPSGQLVEVSQESEKPASDQIVNRLMNEGAAVYLMGRIQVADSSREREYCVYALYNPPRIGICIEHNE